ncbi:MAG: pyridoxamine 5'-phosphate oxidase family protein [Bacillota bacterium]
MTLNNFSDMIQSETELRQLLGYPSELVKRKVISSIDHHCTEFISHSPFVVLSTSSHEGECDVSPRGDAPGFVHILNEKTLIIPERPGNKRMDSLRNIITNPRIGLLFMIPGLEETLRVNGKATLVKDQDLLEQMAVKGKTPALAIGVEVEECFIHCAKAFKRSKMWETTSWENKENLPNAAKILYEHARLPDSSVESIARRLDESYKNRLY